MSLKQYDAKTLETALQLLQQRDELRAQLAAVEAQIDSLESGGTVSEPAPVSKPLSKRASKPRGQLKQAVVKVLKAAGKAGVEPKSIAAKVQATPAQVSAWLASTGKKIEQVQRIGRGKYAWVE